MLGIGENAELRRILRRGSRELPFGEQLEFDWLGDWAMMGVEDSAQPVALVLKAAIAENRTLRLPDEKSSMKSRQADLMALVADLPIWGGIALRNAAPAAMFLAVIRHKIESAGGGIIDWRETGKHAGVPIISIRASETGRQMGGEDMRGFLDRLALYYAFCPDSLILSLSEPTLRRRIDECKAGAGPKAAPSGQPGAHQEAQWLMELGMRRGGPMWRGLGWLLAQLPLEGERRAAASAQAVLRGLPGIEGEAASRMALDTLGYVPLTADGEQFSLAPEGVTSRLRGSTHAPRRPALPVEGSPAARLLEQLQQVRSEVAFDREPGRGERTSRSLHVVLRLRGAKQ